MWMSSCWCRTGQWNVVLQPGEGERQVAGANDALDRSAIADIKVAHEGERRDLGWHCAPGTGRIWIVCGQIGDSKRQQRNVRGSVRFSRKEGACDLCVWCRFVAVVVKEAIDVCNSRESIKSERGNGERVLRDFCAIRCASWAIN